jgi:hypothetical protein
MTLSNVTNIPLPLAVWLAGDGYDFKRGTRKAISATSLLKGVRKILLEERLREEDKLEVDISQLIASRLGHTIHDGIEKAWTQDYANAMKALGYPETMIERIRINPEPYELRARNDIIPVYLEQRTEKDFMGYAITGKFDMVLDGVLHDFKSTSTFAAVHGSKDEDYRLQGSIYRWLNQDKVTADHMVINFIFTDWSKAEARRRPDYPQQRVMPHPLPLYSIPEIENWMRNKIRALEAAADLPEDQIPHCTEEELWRSDPVFKYFSDPAKALDPNARSTKNSPTMLEAQQYMASKGGKGVIVEVPGKVKACNYCSAFPICGQKDLYDLE